MIASVSVIMPVRNGAAFLSCAIESILTQDFPHFELIVVNDGSTDQTENIASSYATSDDRVRLLCLRSTGLVGALNAGLSLARAEFIARMDADDVSLPNRFSQQMAFLKEHANVVVVGGQAHRIDQSGARRGRLRYPVRSDECREYLTVGSPLCHAQAADRAAADRP